MCGGILEFLYPGYVTHVGILVEKDDKKLMIFYPYSFQKSMLWNQRIDF